MEQLFQHLKSFHQLTAEALQALQEAFTELELSKNELLVAEGKIARSWYFLKKGCVRGYYNVDGKEITHWFGFENDFVTSFHSFITQQPAVENVQLMENSTVYALRRDTMLALFNEHHDIERLARIAYEKYYIRLEERYVNAQFKTAAERYKNLMEQTPHILERVPLGYIASYLGISQETLSRIRAKI